MANILVVDDDVLMRKVMALEIEKLGHNALFAPILSEVSAILQHTSIDLVFLDIRMPDGSGLDFLPQIRSVPNAPEVIIITSHADPESAELAITHGAWDFLRKPFEPQQLRLSLIRALEYRKNKISSQQLPFKREGIIGGSQPLKNCLHVASQVARVDLNLLITGETGTGKEILAHAIHSNSRRANERFVVLDCTVITKSLAESLLFGHTKDAFTGATTDKVGMIKQADKGTLFLDEIGELPLSIQKSFLRVIQERQFRPVGGKHQEQADFRLIAATNRDLEKMVQAGDFRQDLFYRLGAMNLELPPLRKRSDDIPALSRHFIAQTCQRANIVIKQPTMEFLDAMQTYHWPGNVRELVNVIDHAVAVSGTERVLHLNHLPEKIRVKVAKTRIRNEIAAKPSCLQAGERFPQYRQVRDEALFKTEQAYFKRLLALCDGDILQMCRKSGLSRSRLYHFLKKTNITKP